MVDLPDGMPGRIARLPRDKRGFPVPWFVQWLKDAAPCAVGDGEPDFRVIDSDKFALCLKQPRCWICGGFMGKHKVLVIGPMCVVNRVTSEPPCHRDCAEYAARACPFLARPRMKRNTKDMPVEGSIAGFHIDRNPGAMCLYETREVRPFRPHMGGAGVLFRLGDPDRVDWWSSGRAATRSEVLESIDSGFPVLEKMAREDREPAAALAELFASRESAMKLLPA